MTETGGAGQGLAWPSGLQAGLEEGGAPGRPWLLQEEMEAKAGPAELVAQGISC